MSGKCFTLSEDNLLDSTFAFNIWNRQGMQEEGGGGGGSGGEEGVVGVLHPPSVCLHCVSENICF